MKKLRSTLGVAAIVLTVGVAALAFAHDGYGPGWGGHMMGRGMMGYDGGYGGMMGDGPGYGHMRGYYGPNRDGNLSQEDAARLEQSREKFFESTRELRNSVRDKQFALNDELQKADPDRAKVADLQKQLSQLESEFDQKALDHQLELRKDFPKNTFSRGYGRGGNCW